MFGFLKPLWWYELEYLLFLFINQFLYIAEGQTQSSTWRSKFLPLSNLPVLNWSREMTRQHSQIGEFQTEVGNVILINKMDNSWRTHLRSTSGFHKHIHTHTYVPLHTVYTWDHGCIHIYTKLSFLQLYNFSIAVIKHYVQGDLEKKELNWAYSSRVLESVMMGQRHRGRNSRKLRSQTINRR